VLGLCLLVVPLVSGFAVLPLHLPVMRSRRMLSHPPARPAQSWRELCATASSIYWLFAVSHWPSAVHN
jgi:hypothetical protein